MPFAPATPLRLRVGDRKRLEAVVRKRCAPQRDVFRARILLLCADGVPHRRIKRTLPVSVDTILRWRHRYEQVGLEGLHDLPRPGRPRTSSLSRPTKTRILAHRRPAEKAPASHWRAGADALVPMNGRAGASSDRAAVLMLLDRAALNPRGWRDWLQRRDPEFEAKLLEVFGRYLKAQKLPQFQGTGAGSEATTGVRAFSGRFDQAETIRFILDNLDAPWQERARRLLDDH